MGLFDKMEALIPTDYAWGHSNFHVPFGLVFGSTKLLELRGWPLFTCHVCSDEAENVWKKLKFLWEERLKKNLKQIWKRR